MEKYFVPYPIALILKEKGFNRSCLAEWDTTDKTLHLVEDLLSLSIPLENSWQLCAPIYQQAIEWLFDRGLAVEIWWNHEHKTWEYSLYSLKEDVSSYRFADNIRKDYRECSDIYDCYNKALTEALNLLK